MTRIAVIDHGAGNLVSIEQGLASAGAATRIVDRPAQLDGADAIVLPGVGSTGAAMRRLVETDMAGELRAWDGPLLGVCVGLQLLFASSEEADGAALALLPGTVRKLKAQRLPHMGWNDVRMASDPIFEGIPDATPFYFVHTYAPDPEDRETVIGTTDYAGREFTAAVRSGNLVGVQFHPERSGARGLQVLANFVRSCESSAHVA